MNEEQLKKDLIEKMALQGLPQKEQDEVLGEMVETLMQRIMFEIAAKLSPEDQDIYIEKLEEEEAHPEEMEKFLNAAIPDYEGFLGEITTKFFEDFKQFTEGIDKAAGKPSEDATQAV